QSRFQRVRTFVRVPARLTLRLPRLAGLPRLPSLFDRQTRQSSRFPIRAAIIASQKKNSLAPINLAAAIEQSVFAQQQPAIGIKAPRFIQRLVPLASGHRPAPPSPPAVFSHQQRSVAPHHPSAIAVNEEDAGEFREGSARLRGPFRLLT